MAKKENKVYIVWVGRTPGIYHSWEACKAQIVSYPNAKYKSFKDISETEAIEIYHAGHNNVNTKYATSISKRYPNRCSPHTLSHNKETEVDFASICVDAACSVNPGPMEYRGVYTSSEKELFHSRVYERGTNNIGEFLAIVHAMAMHEGQALTIYSDSRIAISWVLQGKAKTKLEKNSKTALLYTHIERAEIWLQTHSIKTFKLLKWKTDRWGEIPADFGRK